MELFNRQFEPRNIERPGDGEGVYVIADVEGKKVIDVGETEDLNYRITYHDREDCWKRNGGVKLFFLAVSGGKVARLAIELKIRDEYNPPCGQF